MKLFINSTIALLAGIIAYLIMNQFTSGDMRIIVAIWVSMISAMGLNLYTKLKK